MNYFNLYYEQVPSAAIVISNLSENIFMELLDEYRKANEDDYNIDDFMKFLKLHGDIGEELKLRDIYF